MLASRQSELPRKRNRKGVEGKGQVTVTLTALRELLSTPMVSVLLGLVVGVVLVAPLFWTSRLLTAKNADLGLLVIMGVVFGGMIVALGLMFGYRFIAPDGFIWFGSAVVGGFMVALGVLAVVMLTGLLKSENASGGDTPNNETRR